MSERQEIGFLEKCSQTKLVQSSMAIKYVFMRNKRHIYIVNKISPDRNLHLGNNMKKGTLLTSYKESHGKVHHQKKISEINNPSLKEHQSKNTRNR